MKILIVAMSESVHTQRWVKQIEDQGWDIHLFPCIDHGVIHSNFRNVTVYQSVYARDPELDPSIKLKGIHLRLPLLKNAQYKQRNRAAYFTRMVLRGTRPNYWAKRLVETIQTVKPDIVHSLEFQHAGYLTLEAREIMGNSFPTWIATNWGSDIHLFGRLEAHKERIRKILTLCDFYSCECERDVLLAKKAGLTAPALPVFPNTGGMNLQRAQELRQPGKTSERRTIIIKGYQHFAGRALVAFRALALCADILQDYQVLVYSVFPEVQIAMELTAQETGISIEAVPTSSHDELLKIYGKSRVYIGLSISDAISTSLLESMTMGAYPIQSNTACTDEWVIDGETGSAVPPEDPHAVAAALRRALTDDVLVDTAAEKNWRVCEEKLEYDKIRQQTIAFYNTVMKEKSLG